MNNELDAYMQAQPTIGEENVDNGILSEVQKQQILMAQDEQNLSKQRQSAPVNQNNNVYETLYTWGYENNIFDVDINEIRQYDPNFDINSEDGFRQLMALQSELLAEDMIRNKFKGWSDRQVDDFIEAINNGASISDFATAYGEMDWENIDLRTAVNQKNVIRKDLEYQGKSKQYIDDYIGMLENSNKLREYSIEHHNSLIGLQDNQRRQFIEQLKFNNEIQQKQLELYEQSFFNTLNYTEAVAGLPIDNSEKQDLYDFVFEVRPLMYEDGTPYVDETGEQQYATDYQTMIEQLDDQEQLELHMLVARYLLNGRQLNGLEQTYNQQLTSLEQKLRNINLPTQNKQPDYNNAADVLAQHVYNNRR